MSESTNRARAEATDLLRRLWHRRHLVWDPIPSSPADIFPLDVRLVAEAGLGVRFEEPEEIRFAASTPHNAVPVQTAGFIDRKLERDKVVLGQLQAMTVHDLRTHPSFDLSAHARKWIGVTTEWTDAETEEGEQSWGLPQNRWAEWRTRRSSSDSQRARVLTAVKARRSAPPPLRGAHGLDAGSAHARPGSCLTMTKS